MLRANIAAPPVDSASRALSEGYDDLNAPPERPDLPLTPGKRVAVGAGAAMALAQAAAAWFVAPAVTGPGDADALVLVGLWFGCIAWSTAAALLLVRQADIPDVATAAMLVTIVAGGAFSLSSAWDLRGTDDSTNLSDALMLGVTGGALTGVAVWGAAMLIARRLRLPATETG